MCRESSAERPVLLSVPVSNDSPLGPMTPRGSVTFPWIQRAHSVCPMSLHPSQICPLIWSPSNLCFILTLLGFISIWAGFFYLFVHFGVQAAFALSQRHWFVGQHGTQGTPLLILSTQKWSVSLYFLAFLSDIFSPTTGIGVSVPRTTKSGAQRRMGAARRGDVSSGHIRASTSHFTGGETHHVRD